ncbi:MAG: peptidyl-prolyl cis-trans isomerase [Parvibaculales bacterium]
MDKFKPHPFAVFLAIGALLFLGDGLYQKAVSEADYRIELSQSEIERLAGLYARQQKKPVSEDDLKQLIRVHIEELALAREAERLNLGENDTIIRRRLVQKMKFILEDKHSGAQISEEELRGFYAANKPLFHEPMRISFDHVFISPKDDGKVFERALTVKAQLDEGTDWRAAGDPFMLDKSYEDTTLPEIARLFGSDFASRLAAYESADSDFGPPVGSAYGVHLVRINSRSELRERPFEEVRDQVGERYASRLREVANRQAVENIIQKYDVVFVDDE